MNPLQARLALLPELAHGPEIGTGYGEFNELGSGLLSAQTVLTHAAYHAGAIRFQVQNLWAQP